MDKAEKLVEKAAKGLADLHKVINALYAITAEYAETIDALAREKEALVAELGERETNDAE